MQEFLDFLLALFQGMNLLEVVLTIAAVIVLWLVWRLFTAFRSSENYKQHGYLIDRLGDTLADAIIYVGWGQIELSEWREKAEDYQRETGLYIDPRMFFVLEEGEKFAKSNGLDFEFEDLLSKAYSIYKQLDLSGDLPSTNPDEFDDDDGLLEIETDFEEDDNLPTSTPKPTG